MVSIAYEINDPKGEDAVVSYNRRLKVTDHATAARESFESWVQRQDVLDLNFWTFRGTIVFDADGVVFELYPGGVPLISFLHMLRDKAREWTAGPLEVAIDSMYASAWITFGPNRLSRNRYQATFEDRSVGMTEVLATGLVLTGLADAAAESLVELRSEILRDFDWAKEHVALNEWFETIGE